MVLLIFVLVGLAGTYTATAQEFEEGVNTEGQYEEPESPLFHAASTGNVGVIEHELASGNDVNMRNEDGWTPLMFATESDSLYAMSLVSYLDDLKFNLIII